jgi:hypothetical protein
VIVRALRDCFWIAHFRANFSAGSLLPSVSVSQAVGPSRHQCQRRSITVQTIHQKPAVRSGYEFEKKVRSAKLEFAKAQRSRLPSLDPNQNGPKRFQDSERRYNKRLEDLINHQRACTLCKDFQMGWMLQPSPRTAVLQSFSQSKKSMPDDRT